jgi:hypothetical protein
MNDMERDALMEAIAEALVAILEWDAKLADQSMDPKPYFACFRARRHLTTVLSDIRAEMVRG